MLHGNTATLGESPSSLAKVSIISFQFLLNIVDFGKICAMSALLIFGEKNANRFLVKSAFQMI